MAKEKTQKNSLKVSNRSDIPMFRALDILREVNERATKGTDIRRMGAGQPNVGAPPEALEYAISKIRSDPRQGYTEAVGMPSLCERIAAYYKDYYRADVNPRNVVITTGSSGGFILAFLAAFDAGDRVAITTPTYPAYKNILTALNIQAVEIETSPQTNYQPTAELLERSAKSFDGLIINSPSNPTGTMLPAGEMEKIANWCENRGVRLVSDEAYHGITYNRKAETAANYSKSAIVLNTFSKYFAMTGWRLGWLVLPDDLTDRVKKLSENLFVSPPTISQHLAFKIFDHLDALNAYVETYRENRGILLRELPKAGFTSISNADGAFYVYADVHHLTNDSEAYCRRMLDEARVSTTPGMDFDVARGHGTIRICYADKTEDIIEACERLKKWQS
ncbi:MAG: aminotransferase class I/II-fold pyridoxal phosphate-dependent enzyme [Alphaproteobacteria bacterium]|jgi:aspartate/methionine/tyrosine aminotransferase|nr:aminotransferase class I/II-fold pyridoxal phosphate-dependent enzyme [Alphaproteobacteria bacterium]QQS57379.1 MAG: aminotransferase class I/II-fold pyridoxal phosphate-dependent enzyme [Alphaproteobacteria bacterium]